ncbi:MAG: hypothetical protein ACR2KV_15655 [Solirubrobacteraceae bacterium]
MPPATLTPRRALAYLRELQPAAREVVVLGSGGVPLAGEEGPTAAAARALQRSRGRRSLEDALLAVRVGGHAVAALVPDAGGTLAEHDLRRVASAIAVSFAP